MGDSIAAAAEAGGSKSTNGGVGNARARGSGSAAAKAQAAAAASQLLAGATCDRCHDRHKFCSRGQPCRRCAWSKAECTYNRAAQREATSVDEQLGSLSGMSLQPAASGSSKCAIKKAKPRRREAGKARAAASDGGWSDGGSSVASRADSLASEPRPGPRRIVTIKEQFEAVRPSVAEWVGRHAVYQIPSASQARSAHRGALVVTIPVYMTGMTEYGQPLEERTQVWDYPPAQDIPAHHRRCPQQPGAVEAIRKGKSVFFYDDSPRCPGQHAPPELRERPLRIGESFRSAAAEGHYVLLVDGEGLLQAKLPEECALDGRLLFQSRWTTHGPDASTISPPWAQLEAGDCTRLWPSDVTRTDESYLPDMKQAQTMLRDEVCASLLEFDQPTMRIVFPAVSLTRTEQHLALAHTTAPNAVPPGWTINQTRHRQAMLLAMSAAAPQQRPSIAVTLGGVFDPDGPPSEALLEASISAWEYALEAIKLAWRLLQPRSGGVFDREELTVDALLALITLEHAMCNHPAALSVFKYTLHLTLDPNVHRAVMEQAASDPVQMEVYRRLLGRQVHFAVALRFWKEKDFHTDFGPSLDDVGEMSLAPGLEFFFDEQVDQDCVGKRCLARQNWRMYKHFVRLSRFNERLLNSSILVGLPASPELVAEANAFHTDFCNWQKEAFDQQLATCGAVFDRERAERFQGKWSFLFAPEYGVASTDDWLHDCSVMTLDLVIAALQTSLGALIHEPSPPSLYASPSSLDAFTPSPLVASPADPAAAGAVQHALEAVQARWRATRAAIPQARGSIKLRPAHLWNQDSGYSPLMTRLQGRAVRVQQPLAA